MTNWKPGVDWEANVQLVLDYYASRPNLKYGPAQLAKAIPLLDELCAGESTTQVEAKQNYSLSTDGVITILSNVTMALQGKGGGTVWPPEIGGWYYADGTPPTYVVCPGFKSAWKKMKVVKQQ